MIDVVPASVADASAIHELQQRAFAEEGRLSGTVRIPPLEETAGAIADHIASQTVLLAKRGDAIVGAGRGIRDGAACTIRGLVVDPSCQGQGIGSTLLRAIERLHPDVERFRLTTNTLVPGNVDFYVKHGYRVDAHTAFGDAVLLAQMSKRAAAPED